MGFERGSTIIWRSRPGGTIGYTLPATVVEDTEDVIALIQPTGTVCKQRSGIRGGPGGRNMIEWDGLHSDRRYEGPPSLRTHVPGSTFEVMRFWNGERYEGWYINLVDPWRRTRLGFDTRDLTLDIVVDSDLTSWRWKDEDELQWSVDRGSRTAEEAARVRQDGLVAIKLMEARQFPFIEDWSRFAPDPAWSLPVLPADWGAPE